jgi:hypothetical protein
VRVEKVFIPVFPLDSRAHREIKLVGCQGRGGINPIRTNHANCIVSAKTVITHAAKHGVNERVPEREEVRL